MSDKIWVDNVYELLTLELNPIGVSSNKQINILTKLSIIVSIAISLSKGNFTTTKRTILLIALIMGLYIIFQTIFQSLCQTKTTETTETSETSAKTETFTPVEYNNPVKNPQYKTGPPSGPATGPVVLTSPTGPTDAKPVEGPYNRARVLGCSLNTDDWDLKEPQGNTSDNLAEMSFNLSPEIEAALTHNIPMDPSDEFYGANFSRQIYKIADDQGNFADSLYSQGNEQNCKQGSVFAHLGNPYSVYTTACSANNNEGQNRRSALYLPPPS